MLLNRKMKRDGVFDEKLNKKVASNLKTLSSSFSQKDLIKQKQSQIAFKQSLLSGINHPRIRQLILKHENISSLLSPSKFSSKQNLKTNFTNLQMSEQRKWLTKKGKKYLIDFDDNQRKQMKNCFNAMDLKKNGSIGIDQLQQLLISVGLMNTRQQVKILIDSVDEDKSGKIQFSEFLKMILNDEGQNQEIVRFFKYVINFNKKNDFKNISVDEQHTNKTPFNFNCMQNSCCDSSLLTMDKSAFHQQKNKALDFSEYQNNFQKINQNSALNIFEKHPHPKNLPFGMIVSHIRRKHMLTALKIGQQKNQILKKKSSVGNSSDQNKSNHYVSSTFLRSSKNMKDSKVSLSQAKYEYTEEQVQKGQNVMNNLKKMWDRRLLRQIRERKSKKQQSSLISKVSLTQKGKSSKTGFPDLP